MHSPRPARFSVRAVFIAVLAVVVALIGYRVWSGHKAPLRAAGTPPSAEFIAAAMENQEKPGMSLQVRYSEKSSYVIGEKPRVRVEEVTDKYYVRTLEAIFLKEKLTNHFDPAVHPSNVHNANSTVTSSYNRTTGEYREMRKLDGLPAQGITDNIKTHLSMVSRLMVLMNLSYYSTSGDLERMTRVESVVDYIFHMPLHRIVESGAVLEKREIIDGHSCWGVVRDVVPDVQRHVIWVDPDIGFCPRRIDLIGRKQLRRSQTMRDYQKIGDGIWFPKEVVFEAFSKTGGLQEKYKITVDDAKLVPIDPKVKLQVTFPPGVDVMHCERQKQQTP